jgi:SSS family solute:Na+ symporter
MDSNVFSLIVFAAFLLINFIIGIRASKGVNTMRDYVLGSSSFGIISIFLTLFATDVGGTAVLSGTSFFASAKLIDTLIEALYPIFPSLIVGFLIISRFQKNNNWLTIGDMMSSFYGKYAGIITGIFGTLHSVFCAGIELVALKSIFELFFNSSSIWLIIIIGIGLAVYATLGGINSIVTTDIFKFIIFAIGIPIIAYLVSSKAGGILSVLSALPEDKFEKFNANTMFRNLPNITFGLFPVCLTCPFVIQRILMAKDKKDLKALYKIYGLIGAIFSLILILIAFSVLKLNPSIDSNNIIYYAINECLPNSLKSIAIIALIAIVISSVDSLLHIAGVTIVHDVILPLVRDRNSKIINYELKYSRIATVMVSAISIIVALRANHAMALLAFVFFFTAPITLLPIIAGMIGLKTNNKSYYHAAIATLLAYSITTLTLPQEYANFKMLIHLAANGIVFFGSLMIQNGGRISFREADVNN